MRRDELTDKSRVLIIGGALIAASFFALRGGFLEMQTAPPDKLFQDFLRGFVVHFCSAMAALIFLFSAWWNGIFLNPRDTENTEIF